MICDEATKSQIENWKSIKWLNDENSTKGWLLLSGYVAKRKMKENEKEKNRIDFATQ